MTILTHLLVLTLVVTAFCNYFLVWQETELYYGVSDIHISMKPDDICDRSTTGTIQIGISCTESTECPLSFSPNSTFYNYDCSSESLVSSIQLTLSWDSISISNVQSFTGYSISFTDYDSSTLLEIQSFETTIYSIIKEPYPMTFFLEYNTAEPTFDVNFELSSDTLLTAYDDSIDIKATLRSSISWLSVSHPDAIESDGYFSAILLDHDEATFSFQVTVDDWTTTTHNDNLTLLISVGEDDETLLSTKVGIAYVYSDVTLSLTLENDELLGMASTPSTSTITSRCPGCVTYTPVISSDPYGITNTDFEVYCMSTTTGNMEATSLVSIRDGFLVTTDSSMVDQTCEVKAVFSYNSSSYPYYSEYIYDFSDVIASTDTFVVSDVTLDITEENTFQKLLELVTNNKYYVIVGSCVLLLMILLCVVICRTGNVTPDASRVDKAIEAIKDSRRRRRDGHHGHHHSKKRSRSSQHRSHREEGDDRRRHRRTHDKEERKSHDRSRSRHSQRRSERRGEPHEDYETPEQQEIELVDSPADVYETPRLSKRSRQETSRTLSLEKKTRGKNVKSPKHSARRRDDDDNTPRLGGKAIDVNDESISLSESSSESDHNESRRNRQGRARRGRQTSNHHNEPTSESGEQTEPNSPQVQKPVSLRNQVMNSNWNPEGW